MSGRDHAMKVARKYFENEYQSDIVRAKTKLKMYWAEYQRRLKNIEHYEAKNKKVAQKGIESAMSEEFGIDFEHFDQPRIADEKLVDYDDSVKMGMNTEFIYISRWDDGEFETELNRNATKLIGLIYAIIQG